ncbi:MAG: DPP IV N-terminal domain-containing protein [Acidobacteriota bacterium]|nr:DPP IV N-terminal domain-containing protein [Acidobacteriota bacterium]MDW3229922.1 DPP IV N-terminal domain-containing protein [Acidobacteriota bacterium]
MKTHNKIIQLRMNKPGLICFWLVFMLAASLTPLWSQGKVEDYDRAFALREKFTSQAINVPERASWIEKTPRFWYRKTVKGGHEFILVDAEKATKQPAFDHEKLATALNKETGDKFTAITLPFRSLKFIDEEKALEFEFKDSVWRCDLTTYELKKTGPARRREGDGWQDVGGPPAKAASKESKTSPDKKWEAFIRNYNVWIRSVESREEFPLSWDGNEGDYYTFESLLWSPDSKKLVALHLRPGLHRKIQYVNSSPADQLQPKYFSLGYTKPGDPLDIETPVLFLIEAKKQINIDRALFPNAFSLSNFAWWKDSRAFTFEYNQRGHQVYRVIEVDGTTGEARALINEECPTFFFYSDKKFRRDLNDGQEIIWMSEGDGWNHLYLYDGRTGQVKNQITKGEWVVRSVERVDEERRQVWFLGSGMYRGKDPYFQHLYRVNFDGSGLEALTEADANHAISLSADLKYYVDLYSRVDQPPVMQLRRSEDKKVVMELEKADISGLLKAGWRAPEVFVSKGRDGQTDIWGIIIRPTNFSAKKKYPVIENIYAGPHSSFVPKNFLAWNQMMSLAELGFIVVQIDGMGTSNRSKAFHDVCWKNLKDAGFPDRILWHKAVAAKYPYYDISRVGIYGTSAGGQNALAGLLFHPEFYKVGFAAAGCHDNRMDKLWWNEQWMGWPLGPQYEESSNTVNAHRLQGKLLLVIPELDTNVDPSTSYQVVNALIKAGKDFDLLVVPGANHGSGGIYGERKRNDFFVRNLLGVNPPDWNRLGKKLPEPPRQSFMPRAPEEGSKDY